jgi:hypothetical protein
VYNVPVGSGVCSATGFSLSPPVTRTTTPTAISATATIVPPMMIHRDRIDPDDCRCGRPGPRPQPPGAEFGGGPYC